MAFLPASIVLCLNSLIPILIFTPILVYIYVYLERILAQNALKHRTHRHQDLHIHIHLTYFLAYTIVLYLIYSQNKPKCSLFTNPETPSNIHESPYFILFPRTQHGQLLQKINDSTQGRTDFGYTNHQVTLVLKPEN